MKDLRLARVISAIQVTSGLASSTASIVSASRPGLPIEAGLSKIEVHRLTGIARTTIDRILDTSAAGEEGAR